jgi:predicted hydrolase (HD superfamily)
MTRQKALDLLHKHMQSTNLRRHCYAVEAVMRALYRRLEDHKQTQAEEDIWGIVGLLHDGDYEETKSTPELHTLKMAEWLKKTSGSESLQARRDKEIIDAILTHNYAHTGQNMPKSKLEWSLYCCDELTGLIVAVALVKPDKKLASVSVDSILKKWDSPSFAAGVDRKQIEECEPRLALPLREFIEIALTAMQGISQDLGL